MKAIFTIFALILFFSISVFATEQNTAAPEDSICVTTIANGENYISIITRPAAPKDSVWVTTMIIKKGITTTYLSTVICSVTSPLAIITEKVARKILEKILSADSLSISDIFAMDTELSFTGKGSCKKLSITVWATVLKK